MVRYPHIIILKIPSDSVRDADGNAVVGFDTKELKARVQLENEGLENNASGIVFLPLVYDFQFNPKSVITFNGIDYRVVDGRFYQSHIEIFIS